MPSCSINDLLPRNRWLHRFNLYTSSRGLGVNSGVNISGCNLQILCHEHIQEKMIKFDDWRPLWARVLMPARDTPAAHRAKIRAAFSPHEYRRAYATTALQAVEAGRSGPLSPYPGYTQRSCNGLHNNPGFVDLSEHWPSRRTTGRLATVGWDVGVVLTVASTCLLMARIVGHCVSFKWRW